jgi:hypothetical protein
MKSGSGSGSVTACKGYASFCSGFVTRSLYEVDACKGHRASSPSEGVFHLRSYWTDLGYRIFGFHIIYQKRSVGI